MRRDDRGSVLLWSLGCISVALLALQVMASVISLTTAARELQNAADSAALAAANQLDVTRFRQTGDLADLRIDSAAAATAARAELRLSPRHPQLLRLTATRSGVSLQVACDWRSPMGMLDQRLTASSELDLVPE